MNGVTTAHTETARQTRATFRFLIRRAWQVMGLPFKRPSAPDRQDGDPLRNSCHTPRLPEDLRLAGWSIRAKGKLLIDS